MVILWKLLDGKKRFSKLHKSLPTISEAVLITQLKELEQSKLISRRSYNTVPPHVEYSLTERGESLSVALGHLEDWGRNLRLSELR